jgi:hypothetical protein
MLGLGGLAVAVGVDKWSNLVQGYIDGIYPELSNYILISLITSFVIITIYYYKTRDSEKNPIETQAIIDHIQKDLLPAYDRFVGIRAEEKNNKLVLTVHGTPRKRSWSADEFMQNIQEFNDSRTSLDVVTFGKSALKHLEDRKYKDIMKHFNDAKKLVDKFNVDKNQELKPKIDESLGLFRGKLLDEIDQRIERNILKGRCPDCP